MDVGKERVRGEAHLSKGLVSVPQIASDDKVESCGCGCSSRSLSLSILGSWQTNHGTSKEMSPDWLGNL